MQYVNDDMDEQFRKAAEHYPLDTSGADWSKIAKALEDPEVQKAKKSGRQYLWLLLLLPLGLVCNYYYSASKEEGKTKAVAQSETSSDDTNNSGNARSVPSSSVNVPAKSDNGQPGQTKGGEGSLVKEPSISTGNAGTGKAIIGQTTGAKISMTASAGTSSGKSTAARHKKAGMSVLSVAPGITDKNTSAEQSHTTASDAVQPGAYVGFLDGQRKATEISMQAMDATESRIVKDGPAIATARTTERSKRFYAGVFGGIDATTIRMQKIEGAGFDYGVLIGYELNKKWSVEAGVFNVRKSYYTEGKYFKNPKLYIPPNSKITEVSGSCRMLEIPITVKYNFSTSANTSWFGTAGISSYLMKNEDYDYLYYYATSGNSVVHSFSYANGSKHIFSIVHLSGGYTHRLGKIGDLRIEPYLKIPMAGMGYGKLHLLSAGLHVGLTRKLF